ncbi:hypothetical protein [Agromyces archimandritae]|uniref:Uncharacterized protein n=1 Tax=Agromyces archimandritae TaxID=2781962 RepID=A0A975FMB1_9MICO|nr:hypothetical protein [Agromyces archimandritae]QTX04541.1 hypothetical protein G127AT_14965 [Agromyces archimandritae]
MSDLVARSELGAALAQLIPDSTMFRGANVGDLAFGELVDAVYDARVLEGLEGRGAI